MMSHTQFLVLQTLLSTGLSLRAHALASGAFRDALVRAVLADINAGGGSSSSSSEDGDVGDGSPEHERHQHQHQAQGEVVEQDEELAAAVFMDEDLPVLALRTLLLAATDGHLVALVR